jgi:hypothetical protein
LEKIQRLGNVPLNATTGVTVSVYQKNSQKVIAYGSWSTHSHDPNAIINGIRLSSEHAAIEVQKIVVPAAILSEHQCLLSAFGPPPFTIVCMRKQVHLSSFDDIDSSTQVQSTLPITSGPQRIVDESIQTYDDSWLQDIDEQSGNIDPVNAEPSGHDSESEHIGNQILHELSKGKDKLRIITWIFKDPWHAFHMILIPKNHGFQRVFSRALRDAIFIVNPEDKSLVAARLNQEGSSWEEKL